MPSARSGDLNLGPRVVATELPTGYALPSSAFERERALATASWCRRRLQDPGGGQLEGLRAPEPAWPPLLLNLNHHHALSQMQRKGTHITDDHDA